MNYKVYLIARDHHSMNELAKVIVFEHHDRIRAESVIENVDKDHVDLANSIRRIHKSAIISYLMEYEV